MKFPPEILLLPIFMIADYYLTIWGAFLRESSIANHIKIDSYELNPYLKKEIDNKNLFSFKFFLQVLFHSSILLLAGLFFGETIFYQVLLGAYLGLYSYILGLHTSGILKMRFIATHPKAMSGTIRTARAFNIFSAISRTFIAILPIAIILIFSFSNFAFGVLLGITILLIQDIFWYFWRQKQSAKASDLDS
ncbi:MAG: hypothetical protein ACK5NT_00675 [Pyrinomonadaceae bacterium]